MEDFFLYASISLFFLFLAYKLLRLNSLSLNNLPPSPPSLPVIGHFHLVIRPPIHRALQKLSKRYGPVITLKLGAKLVVIVTSPLVAEECFTKNDVVLANRPKTLMGEHLGYNHTSFITAPYGDHWRNLRKITADDIFSTSRLNMFLSTRKDEIERLLLRLCRDSCQDFSKVEMKSLFNDLTFNNIMRMVAGQRYYGSDVTNKEEAREFKELIDDVFKYGGASNPEDLLPFLHWVTFGSFERKMKRIGKTMDSFIQGLIDEHRNKKEGSESMNTMVDHLFSLQQSRPDYYTDEIIKGLVMLSGVSKLIYLIIFTGTDTAANTIEWALSNLVNHPDILEKATRELDSLVGQDRLIDESDLSRLHYLQNVITEVFRLYPAAPLLVPHYSSSDCIIGGHNVPRDTIVLVNAWAIHRDPSLWEDSTNFKPERFDKGQVEPHYKLMTFGMGRRACPGTGLAQRMVGLTLGSLIQCFEWQRISEAKIDMTEGEGISMPKLKPLEVLCNARPIIHKIFSETSLKH